MTINSPTKFDGMLPIKRNPSSEAKQMAMSKAPSKGVRIQSNITRVMGGGWLELNNGAQAGP